MPELVSVNDVGDMVIDSAAAMRALADPERLAMVDRMTRHGAHTVPELAAELDLATATAQAHVDALAGAGLLIGQDFQAWTTVGTGIYLRVPDDDDEAQQAARHLSNVMLLNYEDLPRQWVEQTEPHLEPVWARSAGLFNAGVTLTPEELEEIQRQLEHLVQPYLHRADAPSGSHRVRLLCYFLPQNPQQTP